jgi:hypothetical protein
MPEIVSRQVTALTGTATSPGKMRPSDAGGRVRTVVVTSPATAAWANGDTIASGFKLPIGTRFLASSFVSNAAMGASVVLDVGIRNFDTKVAIDADGIAAALSVASAGRSALNSGALVAAGAESRTTEISEVYATLSGATPTANAQIRIEVQYVCDD